MSAQAGSGRRGDAAPSLGRSIPGISFNDRPSELLMRVKAAGAPNGHQRRRHVPRGLEGIMFKHILIATDGSDLAERAASRALSSRVCSAQE
jgi:hypothetical protein